MKYAIAMRPPLVLRSCQLMSLVAPVVDLQLANCMEAP